MYRLISKIALSAAVLILMAHTLFPHNHEEDSDGLSHAGEETLIHLLSHVFEQDLGVDHLENYLSVDNNSVFSSLEFYTEISTELIPLMDVGVDALIRPYSCVLKEINLQYSGPPRSPPRS